jgi:hypothetical protein
VYTTSSNATLALAWTLPSASSACGLCSSTLSVLSCSLSAPQTSSDQSGHPTFVIGNFPSLLR